MVLWERNQLSLSVFEPFLFNTRAGDAFGRVEWLLAGIVERTAA